MNTTLRLLSLSLVVVTPLAIGCAADKAATPGPQTPASQVTGPQGSASPMGAHAGAAAPGAGVQSPGLNVSDEIARACNLPKTEIAPSFDFDSTSIGPQDKDLLQAVAKCLSEGALRGRRVALTGRADARGEIEYNMSLGETRADSVRRFLKDMGVEDTRVSATSRGELDANGTDEATMARDRRVDIELAN